MPSGRPASAAPTCRPTLGFVAVLVVVVLAGCLGQGSGQDVIADDGSGGPPDGWVNTFNWSTDAHLADGGVRFTVVPYSAESCKLSYELSGYADRSAPLYLRSAWPKGEPTAGRISVGQNASLVRVDGGDEVNREHGTSERAQWGVYGSMMDTGPNVGAMVYTLAGRGLRPPKADDLGWTDHTMNITVDCSSWVKIHSIQAITDLRLFSYETMDNGSGAHVEDTVGARWDGHLRHRVDASRGELVFQAGRLGDLGYGRVQATTPNGTRTYVVQPYVGGDDPFSRPDTPHVLPAGPGTYRIRADYAGATYAHAFYGAVLGLEPIDGIEDLPAALGDGSGSHR